MPNLRDFEVSMPLSELPPFLPERGRQLVLDLLDLFQCPCPGYLHFYIVEVEETENQSSSFNALVRATSISTPLARALSTLDLQFQCPCPGYLHFYPAGTVMLTYVLYGFQCPCPGYLHFYLH